MEDNGDSAIRVRAAPNPVDSKKKDIGRKHPFSRHQSEALLFVTSFSAMAPSAATR
jgi:hypothetical protein